MGLQVRKRTKGKAGWLNGSFSKKGVGASGSVKVGNVTYNTGDLINGKTTSRTTVNLGNGIRYVSYGKRKRNSSSANTLNDRMDGMFTLILMLILVVVIIGGIAVAPIWSAILIATIGFIIYKVRTTKKE